MDENQAVAQWAIRSLDLNTDAPAIYQGQLNGSTDESYPEKDTFYADSRFMIAMWQ